MSNDGRRRAKDAWLKRMDAIATPATWKVHGAVEINRNQWFMIGLVVLLLGIQLRFVESVVLNEKVTHWLAQRGGKPGEKAVTGFSNNWLTAGPAPRKIVNPPEWLGWAAMSVGSVLILHSLAMKRPD